MVVNATEVSGQAEVIFIIETTAANGAYINELKTNYIVPTLEYFHGGPLEEGGGSGSVYGIIAYRAADCHPGVPISAYGPFSSPQTVSDAIDKLPYVGGRCEHRACIADALLAAWPWFEELGRGDVTRHVLLVCSSPPYTAVAGGLVPAGTPSTVEGAARLLSEAGVQVSIVAARRVPALLALYEHAGGELAVAQQRNYAKDPRHLVLLRGYSLKERPPSPAPPPVPELQPDMYGVGRGAVPGAVPVAAPVPGVAGVAPGAVGGVATRAQFPRGGPVRANWLAPRQPLYATNSALLTQLAQPSYPPPTQTQQSQMQRMPLLSAGSGPSSAPVSAGGSMPPTGAPVGAAPAVPNPAVAGQPPQRTYIWSGIIDWMEKVKGPGDQHKVIKSLPCQLSANSKDIEPDLKVDTWPNKLLMQLMPKQVISSIGGQYLRDSKSVLFHMQPNEALEALTKMLINGFAGCVHFSPMPTPPQCDIKVLILLYTPDKKAYLGFIPNNQATFVERLKKVIQQQKISQLINKQGPGTAGAPNTMVQAGNMVPTGNMGPSPGMGPAGSMGPSGGMGPSAGMGPTGAMGPGSNMGGAGLVPGGSLAASGVGGGLSGVPQMQASSQNMVPTQQMQQHSQQGNMIMGGGLGNVNKGGRVTQLDGLEAARQQNWEKIQQLQQTLEAAHQQEAQFKSQMDVMSHLQVAQQQEQHYKQLEEQRKHQMQQLQLRGATTAQHSPRMRPIMSSNPGLRHLLQQQPQFRPGGGPARPPSQPQQFDDMPWSMEQLQ